MPSTTNKSRHSLDTIQLGVRVPRTLHADFFDVCQQMELPASEALRTLMAGFVTLYRSRLPEADRGQ